MCVRSVIGTSLAVAAAIGLSACGGGGEDGAGSKTVRVTLANHVWTENIKKALPEFEKETGLKVELTQLGEDQLSDQYNVKLNAGSSRHRRDDVPAPAGGEAVRQEQVPRRPDRQGEVQQGLGLRATSSPARCRPPPTRTRSSASRSSPSRRSSTTARTCSRRPATPTRRRPSTSSRRGRQDQGRQPGRRRLRRPHRQVAGRHAVLQLPLQLRRRLRGRAAARPPSTRDAGQAGVRLLRRADQGPRPGERQHRHGLARGDGDLHPGQGRLLHRGQLALQERHRPGQVQGHRHRRLRGLPGGPGRLEAVQHPVVGARGERHLGEQGQRLEVHRVGHRQGADARAAEGRRARCPHLGLGEPGGHRDLPEGPGRGQRRQHPERRRPRPARWS